MALAARSRRPHRSVRSGQEKRKAVPTMDSQKRAVHALNRLTFGPRPGDVERVTQMGVDKWIELQLHPDKIDDSALDARLAAFPRCEWAPKKSSRIFRPNRSSSRSPTEKPRCRAIPPSAQFTKRNFSATKTSRNARKKKAKPKRPPSRSNPACRDGTCPLRRQRPSRRSRTNAAPRSTPASESKNAGIARSARRRAHERNPANVARRSPRPRRHHQRRQSRRVARGHERPAKRNRAWRSTIPSR